VEKLYINSSDAQWRLGKKGDTHWLSLLNSSMLSQLNLRDEELSRFAASKANNTSSYVWYCTAKA